ncbi:MAG: hypothetical protein AAGH92_07665 [Planctomycetota bacterium]
MTVDPTVTAASTNRQMFGLNVWAGVNPDLAIQTDYRLNLQYMNPGFIRVHAADMLEANSSRSWVSGQAWDELSVRRSIGGIRSVLPDTPIMINIPGAPSWMDLNNDGQVDANRVDDFAAFAADLVRIVNTENNYGVGWIEVFNEDEDDYAGNFSGMAAAHNAAAAAIKAQDPTIKVAAGAWTQPFAAGIDTLVSQLDTNAVDAFTYHQYATGDSNIPLDQLFDRTEGIASGSRFARGRVDSGGRPDLPLFLGETNMFWSFDLDTRGLQQGAASAVFDALLFKELIETGAADAVMAWNERDGAYGKTSNNDELRPAAHLYRLANEHLVGDVLASTSSDADGVESLVVETGEGLWSILLINRSETAQTVDLDLGLSDTTFTDAQLWEIDEQGLAHDADADPEARTFSMQPLSLQLLQLAFETQAELLAGDYNNSGSVEQGDLNLVLNSWGLDASEVPAAWASDPPTGLIDQDELNRVLNNWGASSSPIVATQSVPEPTALGFALLLGVLTRSRALRAQRRVVD